MLRNSGKKKIHDAEEKNHVLGGTSIDKLCTVDEAITKFDVQVSIRTWVFRVKDISAQFQSLNIQGTHQEALKVLEDFLEKKEVKNKKTRKNSEKRFYKLKTQIFLPTKIKDQEYLPPPNTPEEVVYLLFSLDPEKLLYRKAKSFFEKIDPKRRAFFPSKLFWPEHVRYIKFPKQVLTTRKLTCKESTTEESSEEDYDPQDPREMNYEDEEDEETCTSKKVKGTRKVGDTVSLDMEQMCCLFDPLSQKTKQLLSDCIFETFTNRCLPVIEEVVQKNIQRLLQYQDNLNSLYQQK